MRALAIAFVAAVTICAPAFAQPATPPASTLIDQAVADARRSPAFVARDAARKPAQVLRFLGLRPDMNVVEVEPGGGYWTQILAPFLHDHGQLTVALPTDAGEVAPMARFRAMLAADPARYGRVRVTAIGPGQAVAPPGSADAVLTFRNLHNWMDAGYADQALTSFFAALKPGGLFGIGEHRARPDRPQDPRAASGYVRQDYAIALAAKAGFVLVAKSDLLANKRDTTDWPQGVWTLPPTYALGAKDHARYQAVGEADEFLLLFRKPASH